MKKIKYILSVNYFDMGRVRGCGIDIYLFNTSLYKIGKIKIFGDEIYNIDINIKPITPIQIKDTLGNKINEEN